MICFICLLNSWATTCFFFSALSILLKLEDSVRGKTGFSPKHLRLLRKREDLPGRSDKKKKKEFSAYWIKVLGGLNFISIHLFLHTFEQ